MAKRRPAYTKEFKLGVLAQINSGVPVAQVARVQRTPGLKSEKADIIVVEKKE